MKAQIIAQMKDGHRETLDQPEFVGDGIDTLEAALDAAIDALEYTGAEYIDVYDEEGELAARVDAEGSHLMACE